MDNRPNNNGNNNRNGGNRRQSLLMILICVLISMMCMSLFSGVLNNSSARKITYDEFLRMLSAGEVKSVTIGNERIDITPATTGDTPSSVHYYTTKTEDQARKRMTAIAITIAGRRFAISYCLPVRRAIQAAADTGSRPARCPAPR